MADPNAIGRFGGPRRPTRATNRAHHKAVAGSHATEMAGRRASPRYQSRAAPNGRDPPPTPIPNPPVDRSAWAPPFLLLRRSTETAASMPLGARVDRAIRGAAWWSVHP